MIFKDIPLSKSDFDERAWQDIVDSCSEKQCLSYDSLFYAKAKELETNGDPKGAELFTLFGALSSFMLMSESVDEPFAPVAVLRNSRSAIPSDIPESHLEVLKEVAPTISDPEMRARVADVLWVTKRDFHMAELAVEAYLKSSETFENPEHWSDGAERLERATRIAVTLGRKNKRFAEVFAHIEAVLDRNKIGDSSFQSAKMMELLLEFSQGDPSKYAILADKAASQAESESNWHKARTYWEIKARWHEREKNSEAKREVLVKAAETYVKEAESAITRGGPSYLVAASHLEKAIEAHRRMSDNRTRVEELHKELLRYQAEAVKELKPLSTSVPMSDEVREAIEKTVAAIKGKSFHDALFELALMLKLPRVEKLKRQAEESAGKHPLQHLFAAVTVDGQGKVVGRRPSMLSKDPDEIKEALRAEMFFQTGLSDTIEVRWVFEPVIGQIVLEHPCRLNDFVAIVSSHPLVPEGREFLYAKGLQAGVRGDLDVAAHFLIPQIEHSLRYVLAQRGVITSSIDQEGIQKEYDLNRMLYMPIVEEIFGEDVVFHLQRLLVDPLGANLRNKMAHGMMSFGEFFSISVAYLYWLILQLVCLPVIVYLRQQAARTEDKSLNATAPIEQHISDDKSESNDTE